MTTDRALDERMMRRAIALAALGTGTTAPNPRVGAVVARGSRILGQGYHLRPGERHAETVALDQVVRSGRSASGATLYTSLEPCCHRGRTPPCVDRILRAGIARVVAAMRDPDPRVRGGGFLLLRSRGVVVEVGLLREQSRRLNEAFEKHARTGLPLVTLKAALTLDGRIAAGSGDSRWITSVEARRHARLLRAEHQAILVGIGTVIADDPRLDRRPAVPRVEPLLRVVLDRRLRLRPESRLVRSIARGPILVFCGRDAPPRSRQRLESLGVEVQALPERGRSGGRLNLQEALSRLGARGIRSLLVEGGGEVHGGFHDLRLADRIVLYQAPRILGGRDARPSFAGRGAARVMDATRLRASRSACFGDDWLLEAALAYG